MNKFWKKVQAYFRRQRRLGDKFEPIVVDNGSPVQQAFTNPLNMAIASILSLVIFAYPVIAILSNPEGLAGIIGNMLAGYCITSGQCNFYLLLPSFANGVISRTDLAVYFIFVILSLADDSPVTEDGLSDLGNQINDRLESLRQDLLPDRNSFAWAMDGIWSIVNASNLADKDKCLCDIRKIVGETMGYIEPADIDNCGDAVPEIDQVK